MNETTFSVTRTVTFDWSDYTVFFMMLGSSTLIGIYFACFGKKQQTVEEHLLGEKNMKVIPVACSLTASFVSGVTLIGAPAEVYTDNASYWLVNPALIISACFAYYWIIPIFIDLDLPSTYQYLELRFDRSVRVLASWFFNITFLVFLPMVVYVPSLTMSQVTGINMHVISIGVTSICVFYTMIGGLNAVIWTDLLQMLIMVVSLATLIILGTIDAGGIGSILTTAYENNKLDIFNFDLNIFKRNTFWTIFVGGCVGFFMSIGTNQNLVQRYLSLKSKNDIPIVIILFICGICIMNTVSIYAGLVIYKMYFGCDPIEQKFVKEADQIFPYYVMDKLGYVPILPGLFIAGIFSAALSTFSTALNTISGIIYDVNIKRWNISEDRAKLTLRLIIVIIGVFSVTMVLAIEKMGKVLSVVFILTSITVAPVSVLFILGMMIPIANKKGAICGAISCAAVLSWIAIGSSLTKTNFVSHKVFPVDKCPIIRENIFEEFHNTTMNNAPETDDTFSIYKLSYMMYTVVGMVVGISVGIVTSFMTGPMDPAIVDPRLISPPLRKYLPEYNKKREIDIGVKFVLKK